MAFYPPHVGVFYGLSASSLWETRLMGGIILVLMLSLEFAPNRFAGHRQRVEIERLVSRWVAENSYS
jgi:hypothetical protein